MSAAGTAETVQERPVLENGSSGPADRTGRALRPRRWATAVAAFAVAVVPLSACAAGINAETSRERPTIDGIGSAVGTLTVRNAYIGGPGEAGGSAPLLLSVFNNGTEPDRLVSISSPVAESATVPTESELRAGGQQRYYEAGRTARLTGLKEELRVGQTAEVVLAFERAGELRMTIPVSAVPPEVLEAGAEPAAPEAPAPGAAPPEAAPPAPEGSAAPSAPAEAGAPAPSGQPSPAATPSAPASIAP